MTMLIRLKKLHKEPYFTIFRIFLEVAGVLRGYAGSVSIWKSSGISVSSRNRQCSTILFRFLMLDPAAYETSDIISRPGAGYFERKHIRKLLADLNQINCFQSFLFGLSRSCILILRPL